MAGTGERKRGEEGIKRDGEEILERRRGERSKTVGGFKGMRIRDKVKWMEE